jgi:hypothetical protein
LDEPCKQDDMGIVGMVDSDDKGAAGRVDEVAEGRRS